MSICVRTDPCPNPYIGLNTTHTTPAYIFWSVFTSLIPTLFYFSVWELGIAGHELALLSTLSPILLSISPLLSWACSRGGLTTLHLLSFFGLAAYALNTPIHRLFIVAFATAALTIQQVVEWAGVGESDVGYQGIRSSRLFLVHVPD